MCRFSIAQGWVPLIPNSPRVHFILFSVPPHTSPEVVQATPQVGVKGENKRERKHLVNFWHPGVWHSIFSGIVRS